MTGLATLLHTQVVHLHELGHALDLPEHLRCVPIVPKYRIRGPPGSTAEMAAEFIGGVRSYFDVDVVSLYDDVLAQKRYEEVNATFRREIESVVEELKRKY
jgi:hypothetical protein